MRSMPESGCFSIFTAMASAGGQSEQPSEVNSSTSTGLAVEFAAGAGAWEGAGACDCAFAGRTNAAQKIRITNDALMIVPDEFFIGAPPRVFTRSITLNRGTGVSIFWLFSHRRLATDRTTPLMIYGMLEEGREFYGGAHGWRKSAYI